MAYLVLYVIPTFLLMIIPGTLYWRRKSKTISWAIGTIFLFFVILHTYILL